MVGMDSTAAQLHEKTDAELIAMVKEIAVQLDLIGQEQTRRIAMQRRQDNAAKDSQENEGGPSSRRFP